MGSKLLKFFENVIKATDQKSDQEPDRPKYISSSGRQPKAVELPGFFNAMPQLFEECKTSIISSSVLVNIPESKAWIDIISRRLERLEQDSDRVERRLKATGPFRVRIDPDEFDEQTETLVEKLQRRWNRDIIRPLGSESHKVDDIYKADVTYGEHAEDILRDMYEQMGRIVKAYVLDVDMAIEAARSARRRRGL